MGFQGGEIRTIRGGDSGAEDVECSVGFTPEGIPFFAYLVQLSAEDLRNLHLDGRMWVVQLGSKSLYPHVFTTAFVAPNYEDKVTKTLEEAAEIVSQAWVAKHQGEGDKLRVLLHQLSTVADEGFVKSAIVDDD